MADVLLIPVAIVYFGIVLGLFMFGINFAYLTWVAFRDRAKVPEERTPSELPFVTIQLPVYNERYVAERLVRAVAALRYPRDRFEIQVLDDSTDDTTQILAHLVRELEADGVDIDLVRRQSRKGFKAGALAFGLERARGEFIAFFDADFIPEPEFLERTVAVLCADEDLAFAQGRWGHMNRDQSLLTRVQSVSIDGHFGIEQQSRWARGHCFNFNGTAGLWRRAAILDAGGWSQRTLTEDLDLSYRAYLGGWRGAYVHDLVVPAEIPVSFTAYRRQQHRWARGSLQCAGLLLPSVWRSDLRLRSKVEASFHLLGYLIHLLLLGLVLLFPAIVLLSRGDDRLSSIVGLMAVLNVAAFAPSALFLSAQHRVGRQWLKSLPVVVLLTLMGAGMMFNTGRAALQAFGGDPGEFERTPKFGNSGAQWRHLRYQGRVDSIVVVEILAAMACGWTVWLAVSSGIWAIGVYSSLAAAGLLLNAGLTIAQGIGVARAATSRSQTVPVGVDMSAGG